jgi:hypothetical protein
MNSLKDGDLGNESWEEYAEHSLTHDDIVCSGGIVLPELGIITNYLKENEDG